MDKKLEDMPKTRTQAKILGEKHYFSGDPCRHGHVSYRFVSNKGCAECLKVSCKKYYWNDYEGQRERKKNYYNKNRDIELHKNKQWREENSDHLSEYRAKNSEHIKNRSREHYKRNKEASFERAAYRRARKIKATPSWANRDAIKLIYVDSFVLRDMFGIQFNVDHIVPLKGDNVCGLHVEYNLRIIPEHENRSKGNKFNDMYADEMSWVD